MNDTTTPPDNKPSMIKARFSRDRMQPITTTPEVIRTRIIASATLAVVGMAVPFAAYLAVYLAYPAGWDNTTEVGDEFLLLVIASLLSGWGATRIGRDR